MDLLHALNFSKMTYVWSMGIKRLLSFFLILMAGVTMAQTVQVSNTYKLSSKAPKFKIIGKNNDGIILRLYGSEDIIDVYSDDLKLLSSKTIEFKNQSGLLQHIMLNKTGAVIFYLSQDKKQSVLLAQPVNSKFMEIGKPIVIDTIYDRKDMVTNNLRFKASTDQNHTLIYYPFFAGSEVQSAKFICLDRSLTVRYNKNIPIGRPEQELENSRTLLDNAGNAYLLMQRSDKTDTDAFDVYRVAMNGQVNLYTINAPKKVFGEPSVEFDNKNGHILFSAFYDDQAIRGESVANGFLFKTIDPDTGRVIAETITPFEKGFISLLTGRETREAGRLYTFNVKRTILRNDGGGLVLAESFIKEQHEVPMVGIQPGFNTFRTSTVYQFNDIVAFSFSPKGLLEWHSIMRKKQASEDDNGAFSSFFIGNEKDRLRLLYLEDIASGADLTEYILHSNGKTERKKLINQESSDVMLLPKSAKQISPDEVVVPSYKSGVLRLVKVNY